MSSVVLRLVLFTMFINDIDFAITDLETKMFKYADDSKFGRPIRSNPPLTTSIVGQKHGEWRYILKRLTFYISDINPEYKYTLNGVKISAVIC